MAQKTQTSICDACPEKIADGGCPSCPHIAMHNAEVASERDAVSGSGPHHTDDRPEYHYLVGQN